MPLSSRTFSQLIDFTRTSAATFVNSSGNIASTAQSRNLLTFTQEFANAAWTKTNSQIVPNVNPAAATLGAELVTNGDFASGTTGWTNSSTGTGTFNVSGGAATIVGTDGSNRGVLSQTIPFVAGRVYLVTFTATITSGGAFAFGTAAGSGGFAIASGANSVYLTATSNGGFFYTGVGGGNVTIDNISVRELSGGALQAPDGTFTADTIVATGTATPGLVRTFASAAAAYTFSIYLKQGNTSFSEIEIIDQGTVANRVRLTYATGALTVVGGSPTGTATSVGNGWWRVTITYTFPATGAADTLVVYPSTTTGSIGEYCFAWGAQLEQASAATDYTRNFGGLFPPRFDYDPVTRAPRGLLIEEQRTNLVVRSEEFDNASWTKTAVTATANATTSPDGTADADSIIETTDNSTHDVNQSATLSAVAYTYSAFVKANGRSWVRLFVFQSGPGSTSVWFNVSTGVVGTVGAGASNATITNFGNGWYRCAFTFTAIAAAASLYAQLATADNGASTYTGDGTSGIFIWGAQLEAGAFATSYIPTVASQVTRSADVAAINAPNFASWYNQSSGTFVVSASCPTIASAANIFTVDDGTTQERIRLLTDVTDPKMIVTDGNVTQANLDAGAVTANTAFNFAGAYSLNDFAVSVGGGAAVTDAAGTIPTVTTARLGADSVGNYLNGHIRSIRFYPVRLTNAQLQALTA